MSSQRPPLHPIVVRAAGEQDLDAIADMEIEIARVSFGDEAIVDHAFHRKRVLDALGSGREGLIVAVVEGTEDVCGWVWISVRTNFLTHKPYGNLRSFAVAAGERGGAVSGLLFEAAVAFARDHDVDEVVGRVHVSNLPMRALYRELGFTAEHLTMRKRIAGGAD